MSMQGKLIHLHFQHKKNRNIIGLYEIRMSQKGKLWQNLAISILGIFRIAFLTFLFISIDK